LSRKLCCWTGQGVIEADPGGKLWSTTVWCLVPVFQRDFGCCDVLIGGESALKKARHDPLESLSFLSQAEPSLGLKNQT
jgi:hypothetical protein